MKMNQSEEKSFEKHLLDENTIYDKIQGHLDIIKKAAKVMRYTEFSTFYNTLPEDIRENIKDTIKQIKHGSEKMKEVYSPHFIKDEFENFILFRGIPFIERQFEFLESEDYKESIEAAKSAYDATLRYYCKRMKVLPQNFSERELYFIEAIANMYLWQYSDAFTGDISLLNDLSRTPYKQIEHIEKMIKEDQKK